ncbi:unnamed protein product [Adineta ricciae]|uniref:Uncharacterized protein n=1 Tax=Adineta ricciae TaxID=249248 RepID=A0A814ZB73_ADIRI|nr:unnamed protein product [Adineta ricciae]CAF1643342.1 unnamed protein product [Adineta ricciae]
MSDNYALFIIMIPNDSDADIPIATTKDTLSIAKSQPRRVSIDTIAALVCPTALPLTAQSSVASLMKRRSEHDIPLNVQPILSTSIWPLLKNYLSERSDIDAVWLLSDDKKTFQITFYVEFGFVSDRMLQDLAKLGIGTRSGTKVFVLPTTVVFKGHDDNEKNDSTPVSLHSNEDSTHVLNDTNPMSSKANKRLHESNFKKSVRARLMVHQVVASIRASSALTFDFLLLICLASMLAAFGLLENSSVIIVASMLVSPLMNPILGIVFGLSVRDNSLWRSGLRSEIIGLIVCITCGFLLGLLTTVFETRWGSSTSFPTSEMKSRGDGKHLWVGVLIALPSGAGVALSVLGGNTGSLVGVAISASLLPPAVNCGLLFAYSLLGNIFSSILAVQSPSVNLTNPYSSSSLNCSAYIHNDYRPLYTCNLALEAAILAGCSLLLTLVNIVCIVVMALIILRIKEVVPLHQTNQDIADFFHYDVPVARDYNKTIHEGDFNHSNRLARTIVDRWRSLKSSTSPHHHAESTLTSPDLESPDHVKNLDPNDAESRRILFSLQKFAKEYDLDVFNMNDYELLTSSSRDKLQRLINDLIDMCQEIPPVFIGLNNLQSFGAGTSSTDKEHLSFYQEIIEHLPPKWHQMYVYERQRRLVKVWPLLFDQSYSKHSRAVETYARSLSGGLHRESLKEQNPKVSSRFTRLHSEPESNNSSQKHPQNIEKPVAGTRFRISKPSIVTQMHGNESKLI